MDIDTLFNMATSLARVLCEEIRYLSFDADTDYDPLTVGVTVVGYHANLRLGNGRRYIISDNGIEEA